MAFGKIRVRENSYSRIICAVNWNEMLPKTNWQQKIKIYCFSNKYQWRASFFLFSEKRKDIYYGDDSCILLTSFFFKLSLTIDINFFFQKIWLVFLVIRKKYFLKKISSNLFKDSNKNNGKRCEICLKLTIKATQRRHWRHLYC